MKESVGQYGVFNQGNIRVFQKPGVQPVPREGVTVGVRVLAGVGVFVGVGVRVGHRGVGVGVRVRVGVGVFVTIGVFVAVGV